MTFEELWKDVQHLTLLGRHKARMLHDLVLAAPARYDVAECGVFRGGMSIMMASMMRETSRACWAFDSFQGLPGERHPDETHYYVEGALRADLSQFLAEVTSRGLGPSLRGEFGLFEETLTSELPPFGLVHVDCDVYASAKTCIERLYPKMPEGGIMVFDDYHDLGGGVERAVNEHCRHTGEIVHAGPVEQAFVVKGCVAYLENGVVKGSVPESMRAILKKPFNLVVKGMRPLVNVRPALDAADYLRDLASGEALPDLPGRSIERASKYAARLAEVCNWHRGVLISSAMASGKKDES